MSDAMKLEAAKKVYQTLCAAIEARGWNFEKKEEELLVHFGVNGDDLPMTFILRIDTSRQLISLMSPVPVKMGEDKRIEGAIATCSASYGLPDGSFDYDLSDGSICFRMTASFLESQIGEDLFQYMISYACTAVDKYNDQFLMIAKGMLSIEDFLKNK